MFWGLNLKPNRKYTQTASKSFHISQAALDAEAAENDGANQIFISCGNQKFLICTLRKDACEQVMLDLNFAKGDEISFRNIGSGDVSLSGYLIEDDSMSYLNGEEEEDESEIENEDDLRNALNKKANTKKSNENAKKSKAKAKANGEDDDEDDDEDEDDSDFNAELLEGEDDSDQEGEESEEDDEEDDDSDDDDEDESEDEVAPPKPKQAKLEKQQKQQNGIVGKENASAEKKSKKDKKAKKENQQHQQQQQQQPKAGGERVLSGGVKVEDVRIGNGPEAKTGKRVQVYYEGRLKSNNKVFDSLKQGAGFKFGLGRGEVIKGWDVGLVGMKVGGKRRIICPPHMAYGARGSPPTIPPNSTLVFEVELKAVN